MNRTAESFLALINGGTYIATKRFEKLDISKGNKPIVLEEIRNLSNYFVTLSAISQMINVVLLLLS